VTRGSRLKSTRDEGGGGRHPEPWPDDPRLDPELLAHGDRRNVVDRYRYWTVEAIRADLLTRSHPFHVAIENWQHDFNIGAVVRNANAFAARAVHIVGRRRWNRRGAMVTDRYMDVRHHPDVAALLAWARKEGLPLLGVDNLPAAIDIREADIPRACVLLLGQEGPGVSEDARLAADAILSIPQFGSTRSINAGVASGIAMYEWIRRHGEPTHGSGTPRRS
jgi:tRNA G18 (ribose-2'-O)-methylase SpoU